MVPGSKTRVTTFEPLSWNFNACSWLPQKHLNERLTCDHAINYCLRTSSFIFLSRLTFASEVPSWPPCSYVTAAEFYWAQLLPVPWSTKSWPTNGLHMANAPPFWLCCLPCAFRVEAAMANAGSFGRGLVRRSPSCMGWHSHAHPTRKTWVNHNHPTYYLLV